MSTLQVQKPLNYFRIAWQSALAAGLCLGLPAGLVLWLILLQRIYHSVVIESLVRFLQAHGLYSIYFVVVGSIFWSYLLGRISGYRSWGWLAVATGLSILLAWFSPLSNVDGILYEYRPTLPVYINYAASMVGLIGAVTLLVGLAYGFVLRSVKAASYLDRLPALFPCWFCYSRSLYLIAWVCGSERVTWLWSK